VLAASADAGGGGEQGLDLGRAGDDAPVDGLRDSRGVPADRGDRVGGEQFEFDGVAAGAAEDGAFAPLGGGCRCRAFDGARARGQRLPDDDRVFEGRDLEGRCGDPVQRGGDVAGRGQVTGAGVERPGEQGAAPPTRARRCGSGRW
jgi:hypothetical protein